MQLGSRLPLCYLSAGVIQENIDWKFNNNKKVTTNSLNYNQGDYNS